MGFMPLQDHDDEYIWAGSIFRFAAQTPFEDFVDFMLFFDSNFESSFAFVCTTGTKAGNYEGWLPKAALAKGQVRAIDRDWLILNWTEWVYPHTSVSDVYVIAHYPEPKFPSLGS